MYLIHHGSKIYYEVTGNKKLGSIVFLHGWLSSHKFFDFVKNSKIAENYELVFLDFLGFGNSDNPADEKMHAIESFAEQACHTIDSLNIENPIIVAHSMGGVVALECAKKNIIKKIILFNAPLKDGWISETMIFVGRLIMSRSLKGMRAVLQKKNLPEEISKLDVPVSVLYGEKDYWIRHDQDILERLRKLKNVELLKMNCGHNAMFSRKKMFGIALENLLLQNNSETNVRQL